MSTINSRLIDKYNYELKELSYLSDINSDYIVLINTNTDGTADSTKFGVVKIGKGINVANGEITAQENTFTTTPYVSITSSINSTNGTDFVFDINCNTGTPTPLIIPLQKCDSTTLGIKYNLTKSTYVKVSANGLDMAFDDSKLSDKITGIESRISALETLLSLA